MNNKIIILGPDYTTLEYLLFLGFEASCSYDIADCMEASHVIFTGGPDVQPKLYNEDIIHPKTYCDPARDTLELAIYQAITQPDFNIPKIGICRGGQFLNVMNGGTLLQHIEGHNNCVHWTTDLEHDISFRINSDHHQGIQVNQTMGKSILISGYGDHGDETVSECCYYPTSKSLCFQPHPEWNHTPTREYFQGLLNNIFGLK